MGSRRLLIVVGRLGVFLAWRSGKRERGREERFEAVQGWAGLACMRRMGWPASVQATAFLRTTRGLCITKG